MAARCRDLARMRAQEPADDPLPAEVWCHCPEPVVERIPWFGGEQCTRCGSPTRVTLAGVV